jgi:hypothetical protein
VHWSGMAKEDGARHDAAMLLACAAECTDTDTSDHRHVPIAGVEERAAPPGPCRAVPRCCAEAQRALCRGSASTARQPRTHAADTTEKEGLATIEQGAGSHSGSGTASRRQLFDTGPCGVRARVQLPPYTRRMLRQMGARLLLERWRRPTSRPWAGGGLQQL